MNQKEAQAAYNTIATPTVRQRMRQKHYPHQQDLPPPMTIIHPLELLSSPSSSNSNEATSSHSIH